MLNPVYSGPSAWFGAAVAIAICHIGGDLVSANFDVYKNLSKAGKATWVQNVVCWCMSAILGVLYIKSVILDGNWDTPEKRWTVGEELAPLATLGLVLHFSYSAYETVLFMIHGKSIEFYLHHVVVFFNFGFCLFSDTMVIWAAWDGLVEITNLSLCVLELQRLAGYKGIFRTINGVSLWLLYLVFRIINLPVWLYTYYNDAVTHPTIFKDAHWALRWSVWPSTLFLWLLSCVWFYKITMGILKAVGVIKGKDKKKK
jgi:hypothetical protein